MSSVIQQNIRASASASATNVSPCSSPPVRWIHLFHRFDSKLQLLQLRKQTSTASEHPPESNSHTWNAWYPFNPLPTLRRTTQQGKQRREVRMEWDGVSFKVRLACLLVRLVPSSLFRAVAFAGDCGWKLELLICLFVRLCRSWKSLDRLSRLKYRFHMFRYLPCAS